MPSSFLPLHFRFLFPFIVVVIHFLNEDNQYFSIRRLFWTSGANKFCAFVRLNFHIDACDESVLGTFIHRLRPNSDALPSSLPFRFVSVDHPELISCRFKVCLGEIACLVYFVYG